MNSGAFKKRKLVWATAIVLVVIFFVACAPTRPLSHERGNLTAGVVKTSILKGTTTQAEVMTKFGSPNMVTRNGKGNEVWSYSRMSYEQRSGYDG